MIRMIQSRSPAQAKAYFSEALQKSDYYLNDQELPGCFHGKLVKRLGIFSEVTKENFNRLCDNVHPITDQRLTLRTASNRTTAYDINFHVPKSVSVLHVLVKDNHILDAFRQSVLDTMKDMEADSKTRVRKNGRDENRDTGELIWVEFIHQTARPVDGSSPDPHLHAHCFTFNVTWDHIERQFKAAQFQFTKRDMPYYQARFHKRLADNLVRLGYRIRRTRTSFEIAGVPQDVIGLFSKRSDEIGRFAKQHGITDAKQRDKIGALTRGKKQKGLSMAQLKRDWRRQIHAQGLQGDKTLRHRVAKDILPVTARQCTDHALKHSFERRSVIQDRRLLATAYRYGLGCSGLRLQQIDRAFTLDKRLIRARDEEAVFCTTYQVLNEEERMIALARQGKGKFPPLYTALPVLDTTKEQARAAELVLTTSDQVVIIEGRAGTGKTTMMKTIIPLIEKAGRKVMIVAPTAQATRQVLKDEGFDKAETVAKLLSDKSLQNSLAGQVLWLDEAGLLGVADMTALLQLVVDKGARMILSGDRRQHGSVARGDALRLLAVLAGLPTAQMGRIYRQKGESYRKAVQALSNGDVADGFRLLDDMGAIVEAAPDRIRQKLVKDYIKAAGKKKTVLMISPTHRQGEDVTNDIRKALQQSGRIGKDDYKAVRLVNLNLTEAEKEDTRHYSPGQIVQFQQNRTGIRRGSAWTVEKVQDASLTLCNEKGGRIEFTPERARDFDVFRQEIISLAKGDKLRITRNGLDAAGKRLNNGQELTVTDMDKKGRICLQNEKSKATYVIVPEFGHIAYGYCMTSHASQGKTVDEVLIYQPEGTFPATDLKQFYVSVSRGRDAARIYTDDKQALLDHAARLRDRVSAMELIAHKEFITELVSNQKGNANLRHIKTPTVRSTKSPISFRNEIR